MGVAMEHRVLTGKVLKMYIDNSLFVIGKSLSIIGLVWSFFWVFYRQSQLKLSPIEIFLGHIPTFLVGVGVFFIVAHFLGTRRERQASEIVRQYFFDMKSTNFFLGGVIKKEVHAFLIWLATCALRARRDSSCSCAPRIAEGELKELLDSAKILKIIPQGDTPETYYALARLELSREKPIERQPLASVLVEEKPPPGQNNGDTSSRF